VHAGDAGGPNSGQNLTTAAEGMGAARLQPKQPPAQRAVTSAWLASAAWNPVRSADPFERVRRVRFAHAGRLAGLGMKR
jgi:hypothetical protein